MVSTVRWSCIGRVAAYAPALGESRGLPGETVCSAGSGAQVFVRKSVLRRFYHWLIPFQRNPTFFQRLPQHAI